MKFFFDPAFLSGHSTEWLAVVLDASLKGTVILLCTSLLCFSLRRGSPTIRHLLWCLALCGLLILPVLSSILNESQVPRLSSRLFPVEAVFKIEEPGAINETEVAKLETSLERQARPARSAQAVELASDSVAGAASSTENLAQQPLAAGHSATTAWLPWWAWMIVLWTTGTLMVLARLFVGLVSVRRLARRASPLTDGQWIGLAQDLSRGLRLTRQVRLLQSEQAVMPMTWGLWHPVVLLPQSADQWSEERRRMILLHELTHVARWDCLTQRLAQLACALHWFNPLVWFASRQLRIERERACDERVLAMGAEASVYAKHLLEIARSLHASVWSSIATTAIARPSQLEVRLRGILKPDVQRSKETRLLFLSVSTLMPVLILLLAAVQPLARAETASRGTSSSPPQTYFFEDKDSGNVLASPVDAEPAATLNTAAQSGQQWSTRNGLSPEQHDAQAFEGSVAESLDNVVGKTQTAFNVPTSSTDDPARAQNAQDSQHSATEAADKKMKGSNDYPVEDFSQVQTNGVDMDYVRELQSVGYDNLSAKQLVALRSNAISADFIRKMKAVGYNDLSTNKLIALQTNGVNDSFIKSFQSLRYADFTANQIISFKTNGVTPAYIQSLRAAGYANLTTKQIVELWVNGVTRDFIESLRNRGLNNLSPEELIELKHRSSK